MFCLGPPFIKMLWGRDSKGEKKFGLWDNCYQMLSVSVWQREEGKKKNKTLSFWVELLHGYSPNFSQVDIFCSAYVRPLFLSGIYVQQFKHTSSHKQKKKKNGLNFSTRTTAELGLHLFWRFSNLLCVLELHSAPQLSVVYAALWFSPFNSGWNGQILNVCGSGCGFWVCLDWEAAVAGMV